MKSFIVKAIVPLLLLILWFTLTLLYISEKRYGISTLVSEFKSENLTFSRLKDLLKGDVVKGSFVSQYPNLGIISMRFLTHERINSDKLEFRFREEGSKDWYYKAIYNTDQFQPGQLFPFGFPTIGNSRGRNYIFELESLSGSPENSIAVSTDFPSFVGYHIFSKTELAHHPSEISYVFMNKINFLLKDRKFIYFSLIYALPIIFYVVLFVLKANYQIPIILISLFIAKDIQLQTIYSDFMYIAVLFIWLAIFLKYKINGKLLAPQIFTLLLIAVIAAIFNQYLLAEKISSWLYLSLLILICYRIISGPHSFEKNITWPQLVKEASLLIPKMKDGIISLLRNESSSLIKQKQEFVFALFKSLKTAVTNKKVDSRTHRPSTKQFNAIRLQILVTLGLWVLLIFGVLTVVKNLYTYIKIFFEYYPANQTAIFMSKTGIYLPILYLVAFLLFILSVKKFPNIRKVLLAIITVFSVIKVGTIIFDETSKFKTQVVIWRVRGNEMKEPWVDVFIDGRNLGEDPFFGKVLVNGVEQRIMKWNRNEIIFRTNTLYTVSGQLQVVTNDGLKSNELYFQYYGGK